MGRPPKRSSLPYQELEKIFREALNRVVPDHMPIRMDLLEYIIIALTERIGMVSPNEYTLWRLIEVPYNADRKRLVLMIRVMLDRMDAISPHEYYHCENSVGYIALHEAMEGSPEVRNEVIEDLLMAIATLPASKLRHYPFSVSIQRELLIDYLTVEKFVDANNPMAWLAERWDRIVMLLTMVPCRCCYDFTHENFIWHAERSTETMDTVAHTADTILAALHRDNPEHIRKTAKDYRKTTNDPI